MPHRPTPADDAALTLLWLVVQNALASTTRSVREWLNVMHQFASVSGHRFTRPA
jgi:transposase-like protein